MLADTGHSYAIFHPLAYLVKLNIEMSMARLIKKVAASSNNPNNPNGAALFPSFNSSSDRHKPSSKTERFSTWASSSVKGIFGGDHYRASKHEGGIKKTEEITIHSSLKTAVELRPQRHMSDKNIGVGVSYTEHDSGVAATRSGQPRSPSKGPGHGLAQMDMSDEETLIKPQPARLPLRQSEDSSAAHSMTSDTQ